MMPTEEQLKKALHTVEESAQLAKAYVSLSKGLSATLRSAVAALSLRAKGNDEPANEADEALVDLIEKILDVMDEAEKIATKESDGDDLEHQ